MRSVNRVKETSRWGCRASRFWKACSQAATMADCRLATAGFSSPAQSARYRATPPTAAARRESASISTRMVLESVPTLIGERNIASFPAVRAIVQAIRAEAHLHLALADSAILVASAIFFRFVALRADNLCGHGASGKTLPEHRMGRQAGCQRATRVFHLCGTSAVGARRAVQSECRAHFLTLLGVHASINFCLSERNGTRHNSYKDRIA